MQDVLFYILAGLALVCGFLVVANPLSRNPVTSALFLVVTIVALSGLLVLLHAFFLAAVLVLVYAGAVMVLFLFVIMLLDLKEEERRRVNRFGLVSGGLTAGVLAWILGTVFLQGGGAAVGSPWVEGATRDLGDLLFRQYLLPFEIVSVILLVAMIGVILLCRKEAR